MGQRYLCADWWRCMQGQGFQASDWWWSGGRGGEMTHLSLVSWPLIGREAHLSGLLSKSQLALWSGRVGH